MATTEVRIFTDEIDKNKLGREHIKDKMTPEKADLKKLYEQVLDAKPYATELKTDITQVKSYLESLQNKSFAEIKQEGGAWIFAVQMFLERAGYGGAHGSIDGHRGPQTKQTVKDFQIAQHLKDDGIPGPDTIKKMVSMISELYRVPGNKKVDHIEPKDIPAGDVGVPIGKPIAPAELEGIEKKSTTLSLKDMINIKTSHEIDQKLKGTVLGETIHAFTGRASVGDSNVLPKITKLLEKNQTDPKIYAYIFYKCFKGLGTYEKTFDMAFNIAKKNDQLAATINEFDTLGGNGFLSWMCDEFSTDTQLAKGYLENIAYEDARLVRSFLLKNTHPSITSLLKDKTNKRNDLIFVNNIPRAVGKWEINKKSPPFASTSTAVV